jgi:hypothetical protein
VKRQQQQQQQQQQQAQAQRADSFSGPGLVIDTVKGLLATPLQVFRLQSSLQQQQQQQLPGQQQQQQRQGDKQGNLAAAGGVDGTGSVDSGLVAGGLVTPEVAGAAVLSWMQLQLAARSSSNSSSSIPSSQAESGAASSNGQSVAADVCLPVCGPMLVHFRVSTQQQQQQGCAEYLLLLVPVGEQLQGAAGSAGVSYLPADLLLPPGPTSQGPRQQQQQKGSVQVVKPLVYELPTTAATTTAAGAAVSDVAQQHAQYVSCIYPAQGNLSLRQPAQPPTDSHQQQQHKQQQQQQQGWLDAAEFPWLQPALQSAVQRLQPRLDLLTWQSWQSVELPLPGGVLLVGGSEGGRAWLLQLLGQQAAAVHGAHVLKVGEVVVQDRCQPYAVPCCAVRMLKQPGGGLSRVILILSTSIQSVHAAAAVCLLRRPPACVAPPQVSCKSLAGQSYETAAAVLASAAAEAVSCCPGLLLLDDLELLMPAPNTEGPVGLEQVCLCLWCSHVCCYCRHSCLFAAEPLAGANVLCDSFCDTQSHTCENTRPHKTFAPGKACVWQVVGCGWATHLVLHTACHISALIPLPIAASCCLLLCDRTRPLPLALQTGWQGWCSGQPSSRAPSASVQQCQQQQHCRRPCGQQAALIVR